MKNRILPLLAVCLSIALCICILPFAAAAEEVYYEEDFSSNPLENHWEADQFYGKDFALEAVINISEVKKDGGRGVKFIVRECKSASNGLMEVWLGNDIWACTNGWKGNGTASGHSISNYIGRDITVRLNVFGNKVDMYIDGLLVWSWEDDSFNNEQCKIFIGQWDAKFKIKHVKITKADEGPPPMIPEYEFATPEMGGTKYYVDANAAAGGDGLSPETAWKTLAQVNAHGSFLPDDQILFKRGCVWEGETLSPKGYGVEGHPIIIDSYGEGALPILDRKGEFDPGKVNGTVTVQMNNQSYWTIRNIQIQNSNPVNPGTIEDITVIGNTAHMVMRHGLIIGVSATTGYNSTTVRGIKLENVVFETIDTSHGDEGNCYKYRINGSHNVGSGGGALCVRGSDINDECRGYLDGLEVENCTFHNVGSGGISIQSGWQYYNSFKNVVIRNNRIYNDPEAPISTSGMYLVSCEAPLVEYNSLQDMTNGIGFQLCTNVTAQYNTIVRMDGYLELTSRFTGKAQHWDGCGIDTDCGVVGSSLIKGNYVEDCYAGSFAAFDYNNTYASVIRLEDNISYNCGTFLYYQCDNAFYDFIIKGNTIVRLPGESTLPKNNIINIYNGVLDAKSMTFTDNIFYFPEQNVLLENSASFYIGNNYTGVNVITKDNTAIEGDPMLVLPSDEKATTNISYNGSVAGTTSLLDSGLFSLLDNSPCIKKGKVECGAPMGITQAPVDPPVDPTEPEATTPDATQPSDTEPNEDNTGLIVGIVVAAVVVAGGVCFIAIKNKKSA